MPFSLFPRPWPSLALTLASAALALAAPPKLDFGRDVRPILSENCFHCHGQDPKKRMANLRLDTFEGAIADHGGHAAVVPGKPESSALVERISLEKGPRQMPPAYSNRKLTPAQVDILRRWVAEGGEYSRHWAFVPPVRPAVPAGSPNPATANPIDAFVRARLTAENLRPNPPASPAAWLRRVSLDLTGLPPSLAETEAFTRAARAQGEAAYAAAADRLLAQPAYGERMALDWLDVARYADTHGFNNDSTRSMWRWRDWVIQSFNANQPYNQFLTEQLAGDLLPHPTLDQKIATGFGRNHVINSEGGIIDEEYRIEYVGDRVRTLGMAWLGLTLECARCHDHKYDPISQKDHYRFFAFFNNVPELGEDGRVTNAVPFLPAPTAAQQRRLQAVETRIAQLSAAAAPSRRQWAYREPALAPAVARAAALPAPAGAVLTLSCESPAGFTSPIADPAAPGLAGAACRPSSAAQPASLAAPGVPISKHQPLTVAGWIRPTPADRDAALFSSLDFAGNKAATTYGRGVEIRLIDGQIQFCYSDRYPAYSIRLRSAEQPLAPDAWHHIAVLYQPAHEDTLMRADASWVRLFLDGREVETVALNEGVALPSAKTDKPSNVAFRVGWDTNAGSARFAGLLDEFRFWNRSLSDAELTADFQRLALPYAASLARAGNASPLELGWLRAAALAGPREAALTAARAERLALLRAAPTVMVMQELAAPRETHVLLRGAYNAPGDRVEPAVPEELLGAWPAGAPKNRLGLAQWLTKPDHPLTSRVVVNRFWQQLFGIGLVKTSENFGLQGESPSHPELLDWLAREFVDSGWNVKALIRLIVLSQTYRQDSSASPEDYARDPENRLLARGPRFRLPAEILRDQALQLSGLLKPRLGGPSVFPYQTPDLYKGIVVAADYPGTKYIESTGDDLYRRSLYTFWKRTVTHPTMTVFDAPDREFCIVRRSTTNTPLQALTLLNDPIYVEAARKLAERAIHEGGATPETRLGRAFLLATGRAASAAELAVLRESFDKQLAVYRADEPAARAFLGVGASPRDPALPAAELAAYAAVANLILNLDEVITKG